MKIMRVSIYKNNKIYISMVNESSAGIVATSWKTLCEYLFLTVIKFLLAGALFIELSCNTQSRSSLSV